MGVKLRCSQLMAAFVAIFMSTQVQAITLPQQCIEAPERVAPCPNLIYTAIKVEQSSKIICFCKADKPALLALLTDKNSAKSRVTLRKLLSQHNLNNEQLFSISKNVVN